MKLLHTSDWHIGRTFHGSSTLDAARTVIAALADIVREEAVDVVLVSGDVWDSTTPSAEAYTVLQDGFRAIREAGAQLVVTSGNHDSAARLGYQSEWARVAGVHVITRPEDFTTPVVLHDEHGPVHIFGIPFLEPLMIRHLAGASEVRTQQAALRWAMDSINEACAANTARTVVLAHCFAAGIDANIRETDFERDLTAGGLDVVPLDVFERATYTALGHIHSRATLTPSVRYCGAPLHYSFSEAAQPRGVWLVSLDATGLESVSWRDLPVPRPLVVLRGELATILTSSELTKHEDSWVKAILTDRDRPIDAMRKLQERFPHCAVVELAPDRETSLPVPRSSRHVGDARDPLTLTLEYLAEVRGDTVHPEDVELVTQAVREVRSEGAAR